MNIAFVLYDGFTLLDFAGFYDPVTRIKTMGFMSDLQYSVCAQKQVIKSFEGLELHADNVGGSLESYDCIFIPGGNGIAALLGDSVFMGWIKSASPDALLTAVCGGTFLLGAAGHIKGRSATTHPTLMQYLKKFTDKASDSRIVDDGNLITAGGVTSAIDLGLYLCEKLAGKEVREKIQAQMDYHAYPY